MKKRFTFVTAGLVALIGTNLCATPAHAATVVSDSAPAHSLNITSQVKAVSLDATVNDAANGSSVSDASNTNTTAGTSTTAEIVTAANTPTAKSEEAFARVTLVTSKGEQVIDVENAKETLGELLKLATVDAGDFLDSKGKKVNAKHTFKSGDEYRLFKNETSATSSNIKLKAPVVKKETADLLEGETVVETKGKDGSAVSTVVKTHKLFADKKFNKDAAKGAESVSSDETLNITKAPTPEVVLVGTAQPVSAYNRANSYGSSSSTGNTSRNSGYNAAANSQRPAGYGDQSSTRGADGSSYDNTISYSKTPGKSTPAGDSYLNLGKAIAGNYGYATAEQKAALRNHVQGNMKRVVDQLGKPYVWGATGASAFDCSGLVYWINNGGVPRTARAQGAASTPVSAGNIKPGDIVWTQTHIGIYVGGGKVVHAANPSRGVVVADLSYFLNKGFKIGRL